MFICCAIVFILFGIIGKLSAVFITIPYPVLGGASIAMFSSFTGVAISNLQVFHRFRFKLQSLHVFEMTNL